MPKLSAAALTALFTDEVYRTRSPQTARTYANAVRRFAEFVGGGDVGPSEFVAYPSWLAKRDYSKRTMGVYLSAAKRLLDWLIVQRFLEPSYADGVRIDMAYKDVGRRRESKLPRYADPKHIEAVRKEAYLSQSPSPIRERDIALIEFLYSSGCRINEACTLRVESIDLGRCQARVIGKGAQERWVCFGRLAGRRLQEYWQQRGSAEQKAPAFARHDDGAGKALRPLATAGARDAIQRIALAGGIRGFHPHLFRHHFGTKMLNETGDLALVQEMMGHKSPSSTRVYAKVAPSRLATAHEKVWK